METLTLPAENIHEFWRKMEVQRALMPEGMVLHLPIALGVKLLNGDGMYYFYHDDGCWVFPRVMYFQVVVFSGELEGWHEMAGVKSIAHWEYKNGADAARRILDSLPG